MEAVHAGTRQEFLETIMAIDFAITSARDCAAFRADDPAACQDHEFHDLYVFYETGPDGQRAASPEGWPELVVGAVYDPPAPEHRSQAA